MRLGKVKSYNNKKGYGFLEITNSRPDVFFYHKGTLVKGDLVSFTVKASHKGGIYAISLTVKND